MFVRCGAGAQGDARKRETLMVRGVQRSAGQDANERAVSAAGDAGAVPAAGTSAAAGAAPVRIKVHNVQGSFSFSATGDASALVSAAGPVRVCGAAKPAASSRADARGWEISVDGAVTRDFTGHLGELEGCGTHVAAERGARSRDARIAAKAGVEGVSVAGLLERAGLWEGANVVAFTSADGFVVRLPLDYVMGRASVVAHRIGGVSVRESEGCTNQLWIEGAPSHYAVRDVVRIGVERVPAAKVPTSPDAPLAGGEFALHPNIGVLNGILKGAQEGAIA